MFDWLSSLFARGGSVRTRDATGNFAIGVEGNVTQVFVQAESGIFGATPSDPDLPFVALENVVVDGKPDISRLLRWNYELVRTLYGRNDDARQIAEWAESGDQQILLRFVEGEGGSGKTRLAAEVARVLRKRGWAAGFLRRTGPIIHAPSPRGLFLIIDYPEEQPQRIDALIEAIRDDRRLGYKLRFLLLSRRSFEAWRETIAPIRDLCGNHPIAHLGPLSPDLGHALVEEAVEHLCNLLGRTVRSDLAGLRSWLERDETHRLSLYATAAAIHLVLIPTSTFTLGAPAILSELVDREMQRIRDASDAAGLGKDALPRLLALAALAGSISVDGLRRLADPRLEITTCPPTEIADRAEELPWWDREGHRLPCLRPDLLAAAFSTRVFDDRSDIAPNWLYPAMQDRVDPEFAHSLGRIVYDMDRLRAAGPSPVPTWLEKMLEGHPERAKSFETLIFDPALPHRLAGFAAQAGLQLADGPDVVADEPSLAMMLNNTAVNLADAGRNFKALGMARRAADVYERLSAINPAQFEPYLAASLNTLASCLSNTGDRAAALAAMRRAVEIRERLAVTDPVRFEPELAATLNNLSNRLSDSGEAVPALRAAQRSVEVYERLASSNSARFEPALATSLNNLANCLGDAGEVVAALGAAQRAVGIRERLTAANPARFEPDLARSLSNLGKCLYEAGHSAEALKAARRAAEVYGRLAAASPARFEPELAASLNNLANRLGGAGENAAALEVAQRAVDVYEGLAASNPAAFAPDVAMALNNLANFLSDAGQDAAALRAAQRAVEIRERLLASNPALFESDLATSLTNLARFLEGAAGVAAARRAVEINERLAASNPARFESDLARSLTVLAICYRADNAPKDAADSIARAIALWRNVVDAVPERFRAGYFAALRLSSSMYRAAGREAEAQDVDAELAEWERQMQRAREAPSSSDPEDHSGGSQ